MLDDVAARIVLTEKRHEDRAGKWRDRRRVVLSVDAIASDVPTGNPGVSVSIDTPLWVMYTSGSTGQPKGRRPGRTAILLHYVDAFTPYGLCASQRGDRPVSLRMQLTVNGGFATITMR
jgi:acyl-coenzyme A synthetase/AMP-(fatty) acid ligase